MKGFDFIIHSLLALSLFAGALEKDEPIEKPIELTYETAYAELQVIVRDEEADEWMELHASDYMERQRSLALKQAEEEHFEELREQERLEQEELARQEKEAADKKREEERTQEVSERGAVDAESHSSIEGKSNEDSERDSDGAAEEGSRGVEELQEVSTSNQYDEESSQTAQGMESGWMTFKSTAYTAFCNTGCIGVTATGVDVSNTIYHQGMRVIAVDPNVIPLNSVVEMQTPMGTFNAIAIDTGGAIKGNIVDILVGSTDEAWAYGRQDIQLRIIN